jgi:flagellin
MSRINTNVQSLISQRVLSQNNQSLAGSLERLSTGLRISRAKDDPSGLIASENLRAETRSIRQAITNAERADQIGNIAEGGLQEVSSLLTDLQALVTANSNKAGLSLEERQAAQLSVDSILQTIDRVASSTNFQGIKLLNGNFDFKTSGVAAGIADFRVNAAKFGSTGLAIDLQVTQSAQQAGLFLSAGATNLDISTGSSLVIEVGGSLGTRELSFASGTSLNAIRDAINTFSEVTGVEATVSGTGIKLVSTEFGADQNLTVRVLDDGGVASTNNGGTGATNRGIYRLQNANFNAADTAAQTSFTNASNPVRDSGRNLGATINGIAATAIGKTARINSDFLDVEITLSNTASQTLGAVGGTSGAFTVTGGGAEFQLSAKTDIAGQVRIGLEDVNTRKLGNSTVGRLDALGSGQSSNMINGDLADAQKIIAASIQQVSQLRGRLGTFQKNVVGATIRSFGVNLENTSAAESIIRDADFAAETAQLTRSQILSSASTNILSLANQAPNSALQLLG